MQGLECLTSLQLSSGSYTNLAATRLTYLGLSDAEVSIMAGCTFCVDLVKLTMVSSKLHSKGLLACTALQGLHIGRGYGINVILQPQLVPLTPLDMSSLADLKVLEFEAPVYMSSAAMLGICKLPSVNHIDLLFPTDVEVNSGFEHLTQVTHLSVRTTNRYSCLKLGFDWSLLKALQCLHLKARVLLTRKCCA